MNASFLSKQSIIQSFLLRKRICNCILLQTFNYISNQKLQYANCVSSARCTKKRHIDNINFVRKKFSINAFTSSEDNPLRDIKRIVSEIFKLKTSKATSLVVENKLRTLCFYYDHLNVEQKDEFLKELATAYSVNHESVLKTSRQLTELEPGSGIVLKEEQKLRDFLTPKYSWLFTHLGRLDGGVKFLVDLRVDILNLLSKSDVKSPHQLPVMLLNIALKDLLSLWFSVGFLQLQRVTWSSPCSLLQKVSESEAVHPVRSWTDIRQRVGPYRRCFVYTHSSMPSEPLVVLHVALTNTISDSMKDIIQSSQKPSDDSKSSNYQKLSENPQEIKAFIFYSISATQRGLQGIDLGNYIIKHAAKELHSEYSHVTQYSSLSPIPTFRQWLLDKIKAAERGENVLPKHEWEEVLNCINEEDWSDAWGKLRSMITDNSWYQDNNLVKALQKPLMISCSRYLYVEKRRGYAYDSVANFHLRNGAEMWRLNWLADTTPRGLTNSCGLMVNYRYYLDAADSNSLKYVQEGKIVASEQITNLSMPRPKRSLLQPSVTKLNT